MDLQHLAGVIPAAVTPFGDDDRLDLDAVQRLTARMVDAGVHGVMTNGGTGEFPHLDRDERRAVNRATVEAVSGRVPVIAGTGACSVREAVHLCEDAAADGADAVISVPPFYFPLPERALVRFFDEVAGRSPLPLFVYNNPLYTGNGMRPGLLAELLERPTIVGLKQSASDLGQLVEVIHEVRVARGLDRALLTGIDSQFLGALASGADGIFSTAAALVPAQLVRLYELALAGDYAAAQGLHGELQPLNRFLEYDPGYVAPAKEGLRLLGFEAGAPRSPMPGLTDEERSGLRAALAALDMVPDRAEVRQGT